MITLAPSSFAAPPFDEAARFFRGARVPNVAGGRGAWFTKEKTAESVIPFIERSACFPMGFQQHPGVATPAK